MLWCRSPAPEVLIGTPSHDATYPVETCLFLPQCRSRVCRALLLRARRTPKHNLGCTTGKCNLLAPLAVARVIRPLSWISFTPCIVQGMFILTCVARLDDGLCWNMMLATSPDCGTASFRIGCSRGLEVNAPPREGF